MIRARSRQMGEYQMYATIQLSPYVLIQGVITRRLPSGQVVIRVQERDYVGAPLVSHRRRAVVHA